MLISKCKIPIFIFIFCLGVYASNLHFLSSGDTIPNSLLAFNLLENHTLHFDILREKYEVGTVLIEGENGHLTSLYPIGVAIVTFPLYVIFYLGLKLAQIPIDIESPGFEGYRLIFERLAAMITTAASVVLFYLSSRLKFSQTIALISTMLFAFATSTWVISSQALWQQGAMNFVTLGLLFSLLQANRTSDRYQGYYLLVAGVCSGLLPSIRPTGLLISLTALIYSLFSFQGKAKFFLLGLPIALLNTFWNLYFFHNCLGGYGKIASKLYQFSIPSILKTLSGLLISPGRGLLIYTPVLLFSVIGLSLIYKLRTFRDEQFILGLNSAAIIVLASYSSYIIWWGGFCYGPRLISEVLPAFCYNINYFLKLVIGARSNGLLARSQTGLLGLFSLSLLYSIYVQALGAYSTTGHSWFFVPLNVDAHPARLWQWQDNPLVRHQNSLLHRIFKPDIQKLQAVDGLSGAITEIFVNTTPLKDQYIGKAGETLLLTAQVVNQGNASWFGYEAAVEVGEVRVDIHVFREQKTIDQAFQQLYIAQNTQPNQATTAVGEFRLPNQTGTYDAYFNLTALGITPLPRDTRQSLYHLRLIVQEN